jgi:hypothetical protein
MPITQDELDRFHRFASDLLQNGGRTMSLEEILSRWQTAREREEVNAALREASDDLKAGRARPAKKVTRELRKKHHLPAE